MPRNPRGIRLPVTIGRRVVAEFLHQSRNVPLVTVQRGFAVPGLAKVRASTVPRVSWVALFAKAYALAARRHAALRRSWTTFPFHRIYEHNESVGVVLVEREWRDEEVVLGGRIRGPETTPLADIDGHVHRLQSAPVWSISCFRQVLRLGRYPSFLRRFLMWSSLHWSGFKRSKRFGTFLVSSLGNFGCESVDLKVPLTGYLTYGPISADGRVTVSLTFDHRVLDGRQAARALCDMESFMNTALVAELRSVTVGRQAPVVDGEISMAAYEPSAAD
jgi:2-oxoacid dehydrogenases acyltransferase (catalytic domain)